jgi:predicted nucleic acid-binding protein
MNFILDASVALSWCFADEATPTSKHLLRQLETSIAHVPAVWRLEVGNALLSAIRRQRLTPADATEFLFLVDQLNIEIDLAMSERANHEIFFLAQAQELTTYDAAYLDLAMRRALPLATRDHALIAAAKRVGVDII